MQIWMDAFLSSKSPTEEQLAGLSDYSVLRSSGKKGRKLQDSTMYPILVRSHLIVNGPGADIHRTS